MSMVQNICFPDLSWLFTPGQCIAPRSPSTCAVKDEHRGFPANVAVAQQRCECKQPSNLLQVNTLQQDKEASPEPALSARATQDAARAAIMGQALQASSVTQLSTL